MWESPTIAEGLVAGGCQSVLNLIHLVVDLLVETIAWYQIVLMLLLSLVGILLNIVSSQWMRSSIHQQKV